MKEEMKTHPLSNYLNAPMAILPSVLKSLVMGIKNPLAESSIGRADVNVTKPANSSGIAMVKIHGVLIPHIPDYYSDRYASPQRLAAQFKLAADSSEVKEIFVDVHCPGGVAMCLDELSDAVGYASGLKPVNVCINGYGASGGYWGIARATEISVTRLSQVGSVGVITTHADYSKMLEEEGIDYQVYRTGSQKALGQVIDPNDDTMYQTTMKELNDILSVFAMDVALGRGLSVEDALNRYALDSDAPNALRGNTVLGEEAVSLGLADRIATPNEVLTEMLTRINKSAKTRFVMKGATKMDVNEVSLEQVQANAAKTERERIASVLGITGELKDSDLTVLIKQAADGKAYRVSLLERLKLATVSLTGGMYAEADAARSVRIFSDASIEDLEAEVKAREDKVAAMIPNKQLSTEAKVNTERKDASGV